MKKQTFARNLWLSLLPSLIRLAVIPGVDTWLLRQVHRPNHVPAFRGSAKRSLLGQPLLDESPAHGRDGGV